MKHTQKYLLLHQRAECILEMIERCDELRNDAINYLSTNFPAPWFYATKGIYETQLLKYTAIKNRLLAAYSNVVHRIVTPVINNATEIGSFIVDEKGIAIA